jgi:hypothetical protein
MGIYGGIGELLEMLSVEGRWARCWWPPKKGRVIGTAREKKVSYLPQYGRFMGMRGWIGELLEILSPLSILPFQNPSHQTFVSCPSRSRTSSYICYAPGSQARLVGAWWTLEETPKTLTL